MNSQEEATYEEILKSRLAPAQQTKLSHLIDSSPYSSTVLRGFVDWLESNGAIEEAESLGSYIVNVYAPLEAQHV